MKNDNNQLLNILLPNLKNPNSLQKNIKIDFDAIKKKIIDKSSEIENKNKGVGIPKKFSKGELKSIFVKNSLLVAVRIRKLNNKEIEFSTHETIKKIDRDTLIITEPIDPQINLEKENSSILKPQKNKENYFSFDFIFGKETTQEEIYLNTSKLLLEEVLEGYNSTVFCYGATGSGKTYTMVGNGENPGIMVRAVSDLFSLIELKKNKKINIKVMYVEVYNENIRDLISDKNDLEVREDPKYGIQIIGGSEEQVLNSGDVFKLLIKGNKNRSEEPNFSNETSSRSHAILILNLEIKEKHSSSSGSPESKQISETSLGKFILVDLAGSEKGANHQLKSLRSLESSNINKSLLALGNCINGLVESYTKGSKPFIPWRDSKLTRLLKVF